MKELLCRRSVQRRLWGPCLVLLCSWLLLGCTREGAGSMPTGGEALAAPTGRPQLRTRQEGVGVDACGGIWPQEERVTVRGLFRTAGEQAYLDVVHMPPESPPCWARLFLDPQPDVGRVSWEAPLYLEVSGWLSTSRWSSAGLWDLRVDEWAELLFDPVGARQACREAVRAATAELQQLDWGSLATPTYAEVTAAYHLSAEDLASVEVQIQGVDPDRPLVLLTARGPDLPQVRPLVFRWVAVECVYDVAAEQVLVLVATIQGEVQE